MNIGNLPPQEELIFITEYIQFLESSDNKYEHELFRNLPQFNSNYIDSLNYEIEGIFEINTKYNIKNFKKNFLSEKLKIKEEVKNENKIFIKYEYINLKTNVKINKPNFGGGGGGSIAALFGKKKKSNNKILKTNLKTLYIPSNKIYFELESNNSFLFSQIFPKNKNEQA